MIFDCVDSAGQLVLDADRGATWVHGRLWCLVLELEGSDLNPLEGSKQ